MVAAYPDSRQLAVVLLNIPTSTARRTRSGPTRSAVQQCPIDQKNEASDSERNRDQGGNDQRGHPCAAKHGHSYALRSAEPDDQGSDARHLRVFHPRLGRAPTLWLNRDGKLVVRSWWSSTHRNYFGRVQPP